MRAALLALLLLLPAAPAGPAWPLPRASRSHAVSLAFQRAHPCPATGRPYGRCPGWIRDHIWPLCAGGADAAANLQWLRLADARAKDRWERALCRRLKTWRG